MRKKGDKFLYLSSELRINVHLLGYCKFLVYQIYSTSSIKEAKTIIKNINSWYIKLLYGNLNYLPKKMGDGGLFSINPHSLYSINPFAYEAIFVKSI